MTGPVTRKEWLSHERQHFKILFAQHPEWPPNKRQRMAREATEALHGPCPPGLRWMLIKLGWAIFRQGEDMDFSWMKNIWKAVRAALGLALAAMIYAGFEVLFQSFDTPEEWAALGAPQFVIPIILALLVSFRNWLKVRKGRSFFGWL